MTPSISKLHLLGLLGLSLVLAGSLLTLPANYTQAKDEDSVTGSDSSELTEAQKIEAEAAKKAIEELREQSKKSRDSRQKALDEAKSARGEKKLEKSQELARELTKERLELLKKLQSENQTKKCRAAAKTEATAAINIVIARLSQDQTDITSLKTVDEIRAFIKAETIGKNHVYVALLPAIRGMCTADKIIGLVDGKLATIVTRLKVAGLDTTKLETLLANTKLQALGAYDAYKKIANSPGSNSYKTDLAAAKANLKKAKTSLSAARDEIDRLKESVNKDSSDSTE